VLPEPEKWLKILSFSRKWENEKQPQVLRLAALAQNDKVVYGKRVLVFVLMGGPKVM